MISYKSPDIRIVRIGEHIEGIGKVDDISDSTPTLYERLRDAVPIPAQDVDTTGMRVGCGASYDSTAYDKEKGTFDTVGLGGKMKGEQSQKIEMAEYTMEDAMAHGFSSLELYKLWHWATCFPQATWHDEIVTSVTRIRDELKERFVELPADAIGVPIKVGDRLTDGEYKFIVDYIEFHDGQFTVCDENGVARACCDVEHVPDPSLTEIDAKKESTTEDVRCSFCGKEKKDVSFLIKSTKAEDGPCICDECVMSAFSLMLCRGRGEQ